MENVQTTANAEILTERLASMIDAGRLGTARPCWRPFARLALPSPRLAELAARLAMHEGRFDVSPAKNWTTTVALATGERRAAQVPGRCPHADG